MPSRQVAAIQNEGTKRIFHSFFALLIYGIFRRSMPTPTKQAASSTTPTVGTTSKGSTSANRNRKNKIATSNNSGISKRKEKLYCVCRTPFDDSK